MINDEVKNRSKIAGPERSESNREKHKLPGRKTEKSTTIRTTKITKNKTKCAVESAQDT